MKNKIFCENCLFYNNERISNRNSIEQCNHPENLKYKDTYLSRTYTPIESPKKINKNNDCKWFKPFNYYDTGADL